MKKFVNPKSLGKEPEIYSHGVLVSFSKLLFTAGKVAMDDQGKVIGKGDIEVQTNYIMESLKNILADVGMDFNNVVKINMYLINIDDLPKVIAIRKRYFDFRSNRPASTAIGITRLVNPDLLIEIEIIAVK
jgi:enamine deaminase RidA (YjgF/YER057c/UK114 family)